MIALVPVRDGVLPAGADEAIAECGGRAILVGSGLDDLDLDGLALTAHLVELGDVEPGRWSAVLPAAHRLDHRRRRIDRAAEFTRWTRPRSAAGGRDAPAAARRGDDREPAASSVSPAAAASNCTNTIPPRPFVATLQPGVRGAERFTAAVEITAASTHRRGGAASTDASRRPSTPASSRCCRPTCAPWT